jgi:hypothetical protein
MLEDDTLAGCGAVLEERVDVADEGRILDGFPGSGAPACAEPIWGPFLET